MVCRKAVPSIVASFVQVAGLGMGVRNLDDIEDHTLGRMRGGRKKK